jgi:hypothetical protein
MTERSLAALSSVVVPDETRLRVISSRTWADHRTWDLFAKAYALDPTFKPVWHR